MYNKVYGREVKYGFSEKPYEVPTISFPENQNYTALKNAQSLFVQVNHDYFFNRLGCYSIKVDDIYKYSCNLI